jgi:hypothetical protein
LPGDLKVMGNGLLVVPKEGLAQTSVLIAIEPVRLTSHKTKMRIGVYSGAKRLESVNTIFTGPRT